MKMSRRVVLLGSLSLCLAACASAPREVDFARNDILCSDLPFATRAPGDRIVFVAPVIDLRPTTLPAHDRGFPISYGPDGAWDRPVADMLGEILTRELDESGLFAQVSPQAVPNAVVIQPELVAFTMGTIENIQGASTFAEVAIKLRVLGPADAQGERPLWFERAYGERQVTEPRLVPSNMFLLAGNTVTRSLAKVMSGLDGTNVGRSGVPLQLAERGSSPERPAEASAPTR